MTIASIIREHGDILAYLGNSAEDIISKIDIDEQEDIAITFGFKDFDQMKSIFLSKFFSTWFNQYFSEILKK